MLKKRQWNAAATSPAWTQEHFTTYDTVCNKIKACLFVKQVWFYSGGHFSLLTFSDCFSLVLNLTVVSLITGSMWQYLDTTEAAQIVQLIKDSTSICAIARRFTVSASTNSRAWRGFQ